MVRKGLPGLSKLLTRKQKRKDFVYFVYFVYWKE